MLDELPALIAAGYEQTPEEDLVRLKWWGLYHDKPKIGTFMLRIKLPAGRATAAQLRAVGELSVRYGKGSGELSTRQTIQLHYLELCVPARGVPPPGRGRTDDRRRVRRRRAERDRLPRRGRRRGRALRRHARPRGGDALLLRQPGLLRPAAQAQDHDLRLRPPLQRARDQLHRARRGRPRRRARVRRPRRRRPLVRAAARARPRRLRPGGRGAAGAARAPRRLEGGPALPRLAREGAAQVHGRRPRRGRHARGGRAPARLPARGLRPRPAAAPHRPHGHRSGEAARGSCRSAFPSGSASSPGRS